MPPATKIAKRKPESTEPEVDITDAATEPKVAKVDVADVEMSPADIAKQLFAANAAKPAPAVQHATGASRTASVEGVVLSTKKVSSGGKPKLLVTVQVASVNAPTNSPILTSNIDGIAFGLATKQLEASPDEVAKDANAKGATVVEVSDVHGGVNFLGSLTVGFFTDGKKDGKEGDSAEACLPGMRVLISGVNCSFGKSGNLALYTNSKKASPLQSAPEPGMTAQSVINNLSSASFQKTSALLLSATVGGFFDSEYSEPHLQEQAQVFKDMWAELPVSFATKVDQLASGGTHSTEVADALSAHSTRLRAISGRDAAQGSHLFNVELGKDAVTPYVAPIVQRGVTPGSPLYGQAASLFDPAKRDKLPKTFVDAKAVGVQMRGNLIQIDYRLSFVGNKDGAIAAISAGKMPVLQFDNPTASIKLSMRSAGPELLGTLARPKIEMALREMVPYMDHASAINVYPRSAASNTVEGHFGHSSGFDVADGIRKVGIKVTQAFLDEKMLGGRGVSIFKSVESMEVVEPLVGCAPAPALNKNLYCALSEESFEFDSLKAPEGKTVEFFVVFEGCAAMVEANVELARDTSLGEAQVGEVAAKVRADSDIKAFLKENALVYAVAV